MAALAINPGSACRIAMADDCEVIVLGDFHADGDVDLEDCAWLVECLAGPNGSPAPTSPECAPMCLDAFDDDHDGDVDLGDLAAFQAAFTG